MKLENLITEDVKYKLLTEELKIALREGKIENAINSVIKYARKGIGLTLIVGALMTAGFSQAQTQNVVQKEGIENSLKQTETKSFNSTDELKQDFKENYKDYMQYANSGKIIIGEKEHTIIFAGSKDMQIAFDKCDISSRVLKLNGQPIFKTFVKDSGLFNVICVY